MIYSALLKPSKYILGALCSLSVCLPAMASEHFTANEIAEDLFLVQGPDGNTLVLNDALELVLIDGVSIELAEEYLRFIKDFTGTEYLKALFNSHWHHEQTGLNDILGQQGLTIISHENTKLWLASTIRRRGEEILHRPYPSHALPTVTTYDSASLPLNEGRIDYGHLLHAHTDGDLYVFFPEKNVLFTGPSVRSDAWSPVDLDSNGFLGGLIDGYVELLNIANEDTIIVPGSGPVLSKAELQAQYEMHAGLMASLVELLKAAKEPMEVLSSNPAAGLKEEWGSADEFIDAGFRSFWGHLRNGRHLGVMP